MRKSAIALVIALCFFSLEACSSKILDSDDKTTIFAEPTKIEPTFTPKPSQLLDEAVYGGTWIAVTPIAYDQNSQDIKEIIKEKYLPDGCFFFSIEQAVRQANPSKEIPEVDREIFIEEINAPIATDNYMLEQIADSVNNEYRAYLIYAKNPSSEGERDYIQSEILVEEIESSKILKINLVDFDISRPITSIVWIGNEMVFFFQSMGPRGGILVGTSIEQRELIYYFDIVCQP